MTSRHVVVVGTGAAGIGVLEALRRSGFTGQITVVGEEDSPPYDRPPLSKRFLSGEWGPERLHLRSADSLQQFGAQWLLGRRAAGLDSDARRILLDDGSTVAYDDLVISTGVRPRRLPLSERVSGTHVLRTLDDAEKLRHSLGGRPDLLVAGGGFLGAESAAVASCLGCRVTLLSPRELPLSEVLGSEVAGLLADRHRQHGVHIEQGRALGVASSNTGAATGVDLEDGRHLSAENILMSVGSHPNVEWLADSGVPVGDGVECDEQGRAAPGIWAAGDVASWWNPDLGRHVRLEHRTNATEQGIAVARSILDQPSPERSIPYIWSDQYDLKVQIHGLTRSADSFEVIEGNIEDGKFTAVYGLDGRICAAVGINMTRAMRSLRGHVAERTAWSELDRIKPVAAMN